LNFMLFPAMPTVRQVHQLAVNSIQGYDRELGYGQGMTVAITSVVRWVIVDRGERCVRNSGTERCQNDSERDSSCLPARGANDTASCSTAAPS